MTNSKQPAESLPDCQQNEPQIRSDSNEASMPSCSDSQTHPPDYSVLRQSRKINCLTHFVAPWENFGPPRERKSTSSET